MRLRGFARARGGEVEIGILAAHYGVELCVVSSEAFYILPFPMGTKGRCYLLYTGQHYDPLVGAKGEDEAPETEARMFPTGVDTWDPLALDCARTHAKLDAAKKARRVVKKIKCGGCGALGDDAQWFQEHCGEVDHDDEFCYDCSEVEVVEEGDEAVPSDRINLADAEKVLSFFYTATAPFSSLFPAPLEVGGVVYPTLEHYITAMQFTSGPFGVAPSGEADLAALAAVLGCAKAEDLKTVGGALAAGSERAGWYGANAPRLASLKVGLRAKVAQTPGLRAELLATGDKTLVLVDADKWAGMDASLGIPTGRNYYGAALMELRDELAAAEAATSPGGAAEDMS